MRVHEAMTRNVVTVNPETAVKDAAQLLVERDISALPVVDESGDLLGIVTEADLIGLEGADPRSRLRPAGGRAPATVREVMTDDVITVDENADLAVAAELMLEAAIKHLPVLRGRGLCGILSRHDIVRVIAAPDGRIEEAVRDRLSDEGSGLISLGVHVESGVVELAGDGDPATRRLADSLARSVPGVLDVRFVERRPHKESTRR